MSEPKPIILKLGGSVITDKAGELAAKTEEINRIAEEIKRAEVQPLVIVHGAEALVTQPQLNTVSKKA